MFKSKVNQALQLNDSLWHLYVHLYSWQTSSAYTNILTVNTYHYSSNTYHFL